MAASSSIGEGVNMKPHHLSKKEVEHVAWLAHIELSDEEKTLFTEQFNGILEFFKRFLRESTSLKRRLTPTLPSLRKKPSKKAEKLTEKSLRENPSGYWRASPSP